MKKANLIGISIIGIVAIIAIAVVMNTNGSFVSNEGSNTAPINDTATTTTTVFVESQTNTEGAVSITATLINQSDWSFEIELNTHSVDISEDLTQVSTLVDEDGNEYSPATWQGDPPGGHHRKGILTFGDITPIPQSITLLIRQVGGIDERMFEWAIQP